MHTSVIANKSAIILIFYGDLLNNLDIADPVMEDIDDLDVLDMWDSISGIVEIFHIILEALIMLLLMVLRVLAVDECSYVP
jgi:hypothetical protein